MASPVLNFSLNLNHLEPDFKFSSKFREFAELNFRSSSKFNRNYLVQTCSKPRIFKAKISVNPNLILDLQTQID